jgi:hypothetical protein
VASDPLSAPGFFRGSIWILNALCPTSAAARGMTHIATTSRIIEWFAQQSDEVQAAILERMKGVGLLRGVGRALNLKHFR